jgi:hypothetical protein
MSPRGVYRRRYRTEHLSPTARQIELLVLYAKYGGVSRAMPHAGVSKHTYHGQLSQLRERIGAKSNTHAVVMLFRALDPLIGDLVTSRVPDSDPQSPPTGYSSHELDAHFELRACAHCGYRHLCTRTADT